MKRVFLLMAGFLSLVCLAGCSNAEQDFYGSYTFEKVSYLSLLSSSSIDSLNERMAGTKYIITADLFKMESKENTVEIKSPDYVKEEMPGKTKILSDVRSFFGNKIKYQYTIYSKDGNSTHWRLYISSNSLWVASYNDNTIDGSEVIMYIYKLSK